MQVVTNLCLRRNHQGDGTYFHGNYHLVNCEAFSSSSQCNYYPIHWYGLEQSNKFKMSATLIICEYIKITTKICIVDICTMFTSCFYFYFIFLRLTRVTKSGQVVISSVDSSFCLLSVLLMHHVSIFSILFNFRYSLKYFVVNVDISFLSISSI